MKNNQQNNKEKNQRLLIICNNVLSTTRNNGKTILSYFDCLPPDQVYDLYFSTEKPTLAGYGYYQLSDRDVMRGWLSPAKRGRALACENEEAAQASAQPVAAGASVPRKPLYRLLREVLWWGHWKSPQLLSWLDEVQPTAVFFVGGDCGFAYDICQFIVKRYQARLTLYITDDYLISYPEDSLLIRLRKSMLRRKVRNCLKMTDAFYTVSQPMQKAYRELLGRDSMLAVNMPPSLKSDAPLAENDQLTLMYAGSLYYGRADVLAQITQALYAYNQTTAGKKAVLHVYTNIEPDDATREAIERSGAGKCCGSLDAQSLKLALNQADILVFAESFDPEQIRKTRFSLSTKVPEYLSVGKPILAVGPKGIGSMDYLEGTAFCINDPEKIPDIHNLLSSNVLQAELAARSHQKYETCHNKEKLQTELIQKIL